MNAHDEITLAPLDAAEPSFAGAGGTTELERLGQVTLELTVEVGRTRMTLGQALALSPGWVITLDRLADQPVDLLVNGKPVSRAEGVVIDDAFGLRVTQICPSGAAAEAAAEQAEAPAQPEIGRASGRERV